MDVLSKKTRLELMELFDNGKKQDIKRRGLKKQEII